MADTGPVVSFTGTGIADFGVMKAVFTGNAVTGMGGVYVPPSGATNGARYTVASLKDHLDYGRSEPLESGDTIYWCLTSIIVFDELGETPETITVTLNSGDPRMLIYLMGKSEDGADLLDMAIPLTMAGFMVPEVAIGSIMAVASMFTALGLFAYKKKHIPTK